MLSESFKYLNYSKHLSFSTAILFIWPLTPQLFQGPESPAHWASHMSICLESAPLADHTTISQRKKIKNKKPTTSWSNWNFKILKQKWKSEMRRHKQSYGWFLCESFIYAIMLIWLNEGKSCILCRLTNHIKLITFIFFSLFLGVQSSQGCSRPLKVPNVSSSSIPKIYKEF